MGRIIPYILENKSHVWNHQPVTRKSVDASHVVQARLIQSFFHWFVLVDDLDLRYFATVRGFHPNPKTRRIENTATASSKLARYTILPYYHTYPQLIVHNFRPYLFIFIICNPSSLDRYGNGSKPINYYYICGNKHPLTSYFKGT